MDMPFGLTPEIIAFFLIFIVVVVVIYKAMQILFRMVMAAIAGGLFPIIMNWLGFNVHVTPENIIAFGAMGVMAFIVYFVLKRAIWILKLIASPFRRK